MYPVKVQAGVEYVPCQSEGRSRVLTLSSIHTCFNTWTKNRKTLWKKVTLLKMSNFTFFHNVFYAICILKSFKSYISLAVCRFFKFEMVSKWWMMEWVKPFPNKPLFLCVSSTCLLKTLWGKEKLLTTSNFSFSLSVFYRFGELSVVFIKFGIVICKLF